MYDPNIHHRHSTRLPFYDYTQSGVYFITVCIQDRVPLLGQILDSQMQENVAGRMVRAAWEELPLHYPGVGTDEFVIMPNHIHGIVILSADAQAISPLSLLDVVHRWKSWTTTLYRRGVHEEGWPSFPARLWQRNYYERIVRDEHELCTVRDYIRNNPAQ